MLTNSSNPCLITISETTESKLYWLSQGLGKGHEAQLESADVILVPEKNFREGFPFLFHQDTPELLKYLSENLSSHTSVEICANDDEYLEISLHSAHFRIGKILVNYIVAPLVIGLLTNYIYDELKAKPTDYIEFTMTMEDHDCKSFNFDFKGEAQNFGQLVDKVGQMSRDCQKKSHTANKVKSPK